MAKGNSSNDDEYQELMQLMQQVNQKVSTARVLNGAFDRLESQIEEIKQTQSKVDEKLERLYDPEEGIYAKVQKTDVALISISDSIKRLADSDNQFAEEIKKLKEDVKSNTVQVKSITKVVGEDHKDLENAISTTKGFWKFAIWVGAALLTAIGKMIWDLFIG